MHTRHARIRDPTHGRARSRPASQPTPDDASEPSPQDSAGALVAAALESPVERRPQRLRVYPLVHHAHRHARVPKITSEREYERPPPVGVRASRVLGGKRSSVERRRRHVNDETRRRRRRHGRDARPPANVRGDASAQIQIVTHDDREDSPGGFYRRRRRARYRRGDDAPRRPRGREARGLYPRRNARKPRTDAEARFYPRRNPPGTSSRSSHATRRRIDRAGRGRRSRTLRALSRGARACVSDERGRSDADLGGLVVVLGEDDASAAMQSMRWD